jgi:hypothetical protein
MMAEYTRTHQIAASSKSMVDTLIVSAAVSWRKICKFLIRRLGKRQWERVIKLATIDQESGLALLDVGLRCVAQKAI